MVVIVRGQVSDLAHYRVLRPAFGSKLAGPGPTPYTLSVNVILSNGRASPPFRGESVGPTTSEIVCVAQGGKVGAMEKHAVGVCGIAE